MKVAFPCVSGRPDKERRKGYPTLFELPWPHRSHLHDNP